MPCLNSLENQPSPPTPSTRFPALRAGPAIELAREKHYSIIEIAKLWALSEKTVRKIFEREPGVIHWSTEKGCTSADIGRSECLRRFFTVFIESFAEQASYDFNLSTGKD